MGLGLAAPEGRQLRICFPVRHGEFSTENACGAGSPLTVSPASLHGAERNALAWCPLATTAAGEHNTPLLPQCHTSSEVSP